MAVKKEETIATGATAALPQAARRRRSLARRLARVAVRNKGGAVGAVIMLLMVIVAIAAPLLTTHSPTALNPVDRLQPPSGKWLFGTDNFGRDLFSRTIYGARTSLLVGFSIAALAIITGTAIGLVAGYYRRVDGALMRLMDALMAFPGIILAIGIMAAAGAKVSNVIIALTVVSMPRVARLVRSVTLTIRGMQYVEAAHAIGVPDRRILVRHVLVNAVSPLIVQATFIFAEGVLGEATLSFLGAGAPPYIPSWGNILGEARQFIRDAPWMMLLPGSALTLTVLSLNLLGDGIRDLLDPRLRRGV